VSHPNEKTGGVLSKLRRPQVLPDGDDAGDVPTDDVTGLPTRRIVHDALEQAVLHSKQRSDVAVLAFVEVGQLRDINDTFGPDVGDDVLRAAGERLRAVDLPGTTTFRYEGAVLGAVFPDVPNLGGAAEVARFLIELMARPFDAGNEHIAVGCNVGGAVSTDNYDTLDDMVRDAFSALVEARESGLGAWRIHDESKRARYSTRIDDRRLRKAVEDHEFSLHYQPIIQMDTSEIVAVEALLRWTQPGATNSGMLFPHDFLPLLEKSGLIVEVGAWVINEASRQMAQWRKRWPETQLQFVGCNIGARQLADTGLAASVVEALERNGLEPDHLCLDLTEEALRYNRFQRESAWSALRELKDAGVKLGIDDFGTGMASLSHLRDFRVDVLHLHRSFVVGLGWSAEDEAIVRHITALAHELECITIAEGVETDKQDDLLRSLGVDLAQGFLYGRPMPAEEMNDRLRPTDAPPPEDPWDSSKVFSTD
jgi:diguanylate cyclase (GGDEF)-like protein